MKSTCGYMRQVLLFSTLLLLLDLSVVSQNILDGVYVREKYPSTIYLSQCCEFSRGVGNDDLAINHSDTPFVRLSTIEWKDSSRITAPVFKFNDCVFFNPEARFIGNYSEEDVEQPYFYLNTLDYGQKAVTYHSFRSIISSERDSLGHNAWKKIDDSDWKPIPKTILPYSLRFYLDPKDIRTSNHHTFLKIDTSFIPPVKEYLTPFYFRKYEVTNGEYHEFYDWVRDSIAHLLMGENYLINEGKPNERINWEAKIDYDDAETMEILEELYLPEHERFYRRHEFDTRKVNYEYWQETDTGSIRIIINVYPDTMRWVRDFSYSYNEPMTSMYFWHPAFAEHPVVGITYKQARAFLHWKTQQHNLQLAKEGSPYRVLYELPTEIQWDMAATCSSNKGEVRIFPESYEHTSDKGWITDLSIKNTRIQALDSVDAASGKTRYISDRDNLLINELNGPFLLTDNPVDSQFHTYKADINKIKRKDRTAFLNGNQDELGICFMGGNVSEWLRDDYETQWKPIFDIRQRLLERLNAPDTKLLSELEKYFDSKNDRNGKLVRGGNWYDERYSELLGKNVGGVNAKTFVHPDSSHCTLGFRYVITVKEVEK
ncbi:MAG: SUMF1/EgtB/PvdO family nonheme iron enzyme [Flavobacteriales bacterium]|nr:SUMF1/EgtB/PvdO family nonheme iron enzyme [Flavobacteriales bacterium]